ncbi:hypothetical protein ACF0H5_002365 [Mactra antiquata]
MAELNNGDIFDGETKLRFADKCHDLFRFFFVGIRVLTEEESRMLVSERGDACLNLRVRESNISILRNDFRFNGVCNLEESRSMFKIRHPTFKLFKDVHYIRGSNSNNNNSFLPNKERNEKGNIPYFDNPGLDDQLNLGQASVSGDCPIASASAASKLPEPSLNEDKFKFDLTMNVDKKLKLVIHNSNKRIQGNNTGSVQVQCKQKPNGLYRITLREQIKYGAEELQIDMIYLTNGQLQVKPFKVLKITNAECYMDELYFRGQIGAFEDKQGRRTESDWQQGGKDTFVRFMQCGKAIFKIDFYDFYVYEIVGIDYDPDKSLASQWPWLNLSGEPDVPLLNDKVTYVDLIGSIKSEDDRAEFDKIFKLLNSGNFCNFTSNNKSVMQLCLAFGFSEVIRNFKCIEWNKLLIDHLDDIVTASSLREVLKLHPMVTGGSFKNRLTGYEGHTDAANCKVSSFNTVLSQLRDERRNRNDCPEMPI